MSILKRGLARRAGQDFAAEARRHRRRPVRLPAPSRRSRITQGKHRPQGRRHRRIRYLRPDGPSMSSSCSSLGTTSDTVKKLQQSLGNAADGQFGAGTAKAVKDFQAKNGLDADGLAGPATLAKMSLFAGDHRRGGEETPRWHGGCRAERDTAPGRMGFGRGGTPAASHRPAKLTREAPKRSIWGTIKSFFLLSEHDADRSSSSLRRRRAAHRLFGDCASRGGRGRAVVDGRDQRGGEGRKTRASAACGHRAGRVALCPSCAAQRAGAAGSVTGFSPTSKFVRPGVAAHRRPGGISPGTMSFVETASLSGFTQKGLFDLR